MIDRNHPAVEAANEGVQEWLAGDGPFDDDPARLASDMTAVCITAALPLLESATEDNLARLRNTPAGKQLLAEGWEEGAGDMRDHQENPHRWPTVSNPYYP